MENLRVNLGENSYDIKFGADFLGLPSALSKINAPKKLLIVTDTNVKKLYGDEVKNLLDKAGYDTSLYAFPAGEQNKNMDSILGICSACVNHKMDRKSMIIALGGGVVGDMAGFAAAIYMRGICFVQVPTTLLSQSDSSVGGKTGIDFEDGKNILGVFHQPKLVYINVNTLKTLPDEEFVSGMGEVIKHGIIRDEKFFEYLKTNADKVKAFDCDTLIYMAKTNCAIKASVVEADEKENGVRAILNFGHTTGHAIESAFNFTKTHGECVGIGMLAAMHIALKRGMISVDWLDEAVSVLESYGFCLNIKLPDNETIWSLMQKDKKKQEGKLKFVLPDKKGSVVIVNDISKDEVCFALDCLRG